MPKIVEVLPDLEALTRRALDVVLQTLQTAIAERGQFTIALAGGSTPTSLYAAMATQDLPWQQIHVFWGDERYVPADHPDSNQRLARQSWLNQVAIPEPQIHPMPTDVVEPTQAAHQYEQELRDFFALPTGDIPQFDLILLGMGDDGHTASLFPHTAALQVCDRLITVGNKDGQPRLTFTVPLINQARCVLFLVAGASKIQALRQVFAVEADSEHYPSRLIRPTGDLWWLLDQPLGQGLDSEILY
jgi:6-phosphogluconolactonase